MAWHDKPNPNDYGDWLRGQWSGLDWPGWPSDRHRTSVKEERVGPRIPGGAGAARAGGNDGVRATVLVEAGD